MNLYMPKGFLSFLEKIGLKNIELTPCLSFILISDKLWAEPNIKKFFFRLSFLKIVLLNEGI